MNFTYKCSHLGRNLMSSVNLRTHLLIRSIQRIQGTNTSIHKTDHHACLHNAICKRFYCQTVGEENKSIQDIQEQYQKRFDEYISDPENKKRFQILELEVDVMRHNADKVPEHIKTRDWMTLLQLPTKSQRIKYLKFLWRNEKINEKEKMEKAEKRAKFLAAKESKEDLSQMLQIGEMKYGLKYNSMFLRIYPTTMNHVYNSQMMHAVMFEPKIVFDCSYESNMNHREMHNCAKQLQMTFAINRGHVNPVHLHYCNLKKGGKLEEHLLLNVPTFLDVDFPATVTSQSYLDMFPKDQLVYLTPHCNIEMTKYDPDMVYIVGAMVDKLCPQPLSMAKAKKEGIRMVKLPIEKHLEWGSGSTKSFTLDQMMRILLDLKYTGDWKQALKHVPTRKLKQYRDYMMKKKLYNFRLREENTTERRSSVDFTFSSRKKFVR